MMAVDGTGRARIEEEEVGYNWDELNRLAKQIERDIDGQFSAFNMEPWTSGTGTADQVKLNKLEASLKRLSNVIEMMNELFEQLGSSKPSGTGPSYLLSRHQEVHLEYQRDLRKLRNQLSKSREHTDLITSVREEIDSYRNMSSEQYTQKERNMLDSAHRETDHIVDMAHVAHSNLITQKSGLSGTIKKIQDAAERFPVINQVMMKIRARSMGSGLKAHFDSVLGAASVLDDEDESSEFGAGSMNLGLNPHLSAKPEELLCD